MSHENCQNCGGKLQGDFCHDCGQKDDDFRRPLIALTNEFLGDVFQWDSRVVHTIVPFLMLPGNLTRAYMRGRRQIYVSPLRLYLVVSILFFVALGFSDRAIFGFTTSDPRNLLADFPELSERLEEVDPQYLEYQRTIQIGMFIDPDAPSADHSLVIEDIDELLGNVPMADQLRPLMLGYNAAVQDPRVLNTILNNWVPRLMVILVPFFALIMAMLYSRRRVYFIDHLVFSLHFHSFIFAVLLMALGVSLLTGSAIKGAMFSMLFQLLLGAYLYTAMLRTYRGGWFRTGIKFFILTSVYANVFFVSLFFITAYGISRLGA